MQKLLPAVHHGVVDLREYIKSETFIWDDLILKAQKAVRDVRQKWQKEQRTPRMLVAFPSEDIRAEDGAIITDVVTFAIPAEMTTKKAIVALTNAAKAYAMLLIEQVEDRVEVTLESHHGVRKWTMNVVRHGDVMVLEKEKASIDTGGFLVFWRPSTSPG